MAKCGHNECSTQATFGYENGKPQFCKNHKKEGMINVTHKKCLECTKRAIFNYPTEKEKKYCAKHKKEGMVNITRDQCRHKGCEKIANYNYSGEKKALYCFEHKKENMVNVIGKKCLKCNKTPYFNYGGEKNGIYCFEHKKENMVCVKKIKKCLECNTRPSYNYDGEKEALYCLKHKKENMINIKTHKCLLCGKCAYFNYEGERKGLYCFDHKKENMVNVLDNSKKCVLCNKTGIKRSQDKNNRYCSTCYFDKFPDSKETMNYRTKERLITDELKKYFLNDNKITFDKSVKNSEIKYRPDTLIYSEEYNIIIEIDENQHIYYDCQCEFKRLTELQSYLGYDKILYVIRFNPDKYLNDKNEIVQGIFTQKTLNIKRKEFNIRTKSLMNEINNIINETKQNDYKINIKYLYYNYDENDELSNYITFLNDF